ncbi:TRNA-dihydrouridine(16/17) synthase [NAD(P)(+)]-like [Aphelenchoides fujianensis]|nr:TRNA-dihydrouridine(16/17) synthase [NAD(P)(+)]-like [Aphelenchoides fujianensis]
MVETQEEMMENEEFSTEGDAADGFQHVGPIALPAELPEFDEDFLRSKREYWAKRIEAEGLRFVVAPMVDQSELAFRVMMHKHGAHLFYTPMIHAQLFVTNPVYRRKAFATVPEDRPLIVQFCANNPRMFLDACRLVEGFCDGVDLNLGCPQTVAKRGHYGSFLQEEPELIAEMVGLVYRHCRLPLSVKIRVLDSVEDTINYARIIEKAGASMLTVHGRTRDQRGVNTGVADWEKIRRVRDAVRIPLVANGNIQMPGDAKRCLEATGATAVMSAEGLLSNPALFAGKILPSFVLAAEYIEHAVKYKAVPSAVRAHLFRICHYSLLEFPDLREKLGCSMKNEEFAAVVHELRRRCEAAGVDAQRDGATYLDGTEAQLSDQVAKIPHFYAKPYIRPDKTNVQSESEYRNQRRLEIEKIAAETGLSFRQIRKREHRRIDMNRKRSLKPTYPSCLKCKQPAGIHCEQKMCAKCCRFICVRRDRTCRNHGNTGVVLEKRRQTFADQHSLTMDELLAGKHDLTAVNLPKEFF